MQSAVYADYHDSERHYAECCYPDCRGAISKKFDKLFKVYVVVTHFCVKLGAHLEAFNINKIDKLTKNI
jgi:hypothetical protein